MALASRLFCTGKSPIQILIKNKTLLENVHKLGSISSCKAYASTSSAEVNHDERNMKLGRPLSPHLTVYAPQLTSMLSITHRMTGMALTGYITVLGVGSIALPCPVSYYIDLLNSANLPIALIIAAKFALAFPVTYHIINGVRHLCWDMGKYLTIKEVYTTGYISLGTSTVTALALACL